MDEPILATALDTRIGVPLKPGGRVEVLGRLSGRRRVSTLEQKLELVAGMERCDNVAAFAREQDISTALLYTWRREMRYAMEAAKHPPRDELMFVLVIGWIAFSAMRSIDDYKVEVLISLATVMGGYAIAAPLHVRAVSTRTESSGIPFAAAL